MSSRKGADRVDVHVATVSEEDLGSTITEFLSTKGFCHIAPNADANHLDDVLSEIAQIEREGRLQQPPEELVEGLLGAKGSAKILELGSPDQENPDVVRSTPPSLLYFDDAMTKFTATTMPYLPDLGFEVVTRTGPMLHESGVPLEPPELSEEECARWLSVFAHHKLMCVWCLGPDNGTLELQRFDEESGGSSSSQKVDMRVGDVVLLRADTLAHRFEADGKAYCLTCFFSRDGRPSKRYHGGPPPTPCTQALEEWASYKLGEYQASAPEERARFRLPREWVRLVHHSSFSGQHIAVRTCSIKQPSSHDPFTFTCSLGGGPDFASEVPLMRWQHDMFYDAEPEAYAYGKSYLRHGVFIEGVELFDNTAFRISKVEAQGMDPGHRLTLETGYEALFRDGFTAKTLMNSRGGVYVANPDNKEWGMAMKTVDGGGVCGGGGSIACGRFSFVHGMKGPCISVDVEGASSLVAVNFASANLSRCGNWDPIPYGLCNSWNLQLSHLMYVHMAAAGLCSPKGRVFAFDASASGYVRGDCVVSVVLKALTHEVDGQMVVQEDGEFMGALAGSASNQSGRRAHLTAPDSASLQDCMHEALRQADIAPLDVDCYESFCDARILDDAIEASAACKSYRPEGLPGVDASPPLVLLATKSSLGNQIEAAGLTMLVKVLMGASWGMMYPNQHLRLLNPHMDLEVCERPAIIGTEVLEHAMSSSFTGITNRSSVGTNCHVIVFGQATSGF